METEPNLTAHFTSPIHERCESNINLSDTEPHAYEYFYKIYVNKFNVLPYEKINSTYKDIKKNT
jgi:hypothetical protein